MNGIRQTLGALAFLSLGLSAAAHPPGGLERLDSDGDGSVSREEFESGERHGPPRLFGRADADGDGLITREEVRTAIARDAEDRREHASSRVLAVFDEMDSNGDGAVTREELTAHAFARLDADGDGYLSEDEARALQDRRPLLSKRPPRRAPVSD